MTRLIIGIDPGTKTGVAVWNATKKKFEQIGTFSIVQAMDIILRWKMCGAIEIIFEDARQRKWYGKTGREVLQGAGSIKRDCNIWQEFCEHHLIKYSAIAPQRGKTKWPLDYFTKITGWTGRTSEHARDAAALVYGIGK